jgi:GNAT superfamily N-acetyltransferase
MDLLRTTSDHPDFQLLAEQLEADLRVRDGDQHEYYAQLNQVDYMSQVLVAYEEERPVGCGALRAYDDATVELKRMFVVTADRGRGVATALLVELEKWSRELGYTACVLETGRNQPEAIAFYQKNNYQLIPPFGGYRDSPNSLCLKKIRNNLKNYFNL